LAQPVLLKAVILCGGLGTRLSPVLKDRPKTLAAVSGRPFLAHLLDQLASAGIAEAILATGYFGEQVRDTFQDYYRGVRLHYSRETSPLGTGGALRAAAAGMESALVMNGDSWCDVNLRDFAEAHLESGALNSMVVTAVDDCRRYGAVEVDASGMVTAFQEKRPSEGNAIPGFINAGVYLLSRDLIESIPPNAAVSLEREIFPAWINGRLRGWKCEGHFIDIGTPESLASADRFFPVGHKTLVLLDRDGTINVERHHLASVEGMQLLPGAAAGIRILNRLAYPVVVISNQTVVARGDCSLETLQAINRRMVELLADEGAAVDAIYYCPHGADDGCACRKPGTALLDNAARVFGASLADSFLVGDKCSDIQAGLAAGATTFLVRTGHGLNTEQARKCTPHYVINDLKSAAEKIYSIINKLPMSPLQLIRRHLSDSAAVKLQLADSDTAHLIADAARQLAGCVSRGGKIMLCGNGGSAADSQHIAAEFTSRLRASMERPGIPALALTTDSSFLTARGNDYGFDDIFERLLDTFGRPGDALIAISTSGASRNVVRAVTRAREKQILSIGLLGGTGGVLASMVDLPLIVPSNSVQHIQESHIAIGHILCELVEEILYGALQPAHAMQDTESEIFER
jgi:histidinol-phosphate phosphatase family protein